MYCIVYVRVIFVAMERGGVLRLLTHARVVNTVLYVAGITIKAQL